MKLFALSLLIACSIKIAKADVHFAQILTEDDRTHVLQLIDNACDQFWCDGRYDFKFKSFACDENSATCRLRFKILDRGFIPGKFSGKYTSCVFENIKQATQIFEDDKLNDNFLRELDACITLVTEE